MVSIRSRSSWGARSPRSRQTVPWSARQEVTLHYATGSIHQTPRQIQAFHMDARGWSDVGYNLLVDHEGVAYEGRGWSVVGAHAAPRNSQGIGICYIGDDGMTDAAKATVIALYDEACERAGRTLDRKGHRDINSTSCPGTKNYEWWTSPDFRDAAGTTEVNDMLGLSIGSDGEAVKLLQLKVTRAGFGDALGKAGADGKYGEGTAEAVRLTRAYVGSRALKGYGDEMTAHACDQVEAAVVKRALENALKGGGGSGSGSLVGATVTSKIVKVEG
ncbi:N-acetylmuramoyl-L-alanine amidase [Nocardiopsis dassonvillei]|uniref:peptidoglycan recognition protein family protein n=1 Tax=Nocardiopsis dassonvillei TaxID=2014 RepID=UPI00370024C0